ncbi:MAG TPA: DUF6782 family putative metallopeptidase [Terriglobia bacterium]|nr:DUF6782 family putative metallopeptidase [Terriglobia bacterium]
MTCHQVAFRFPSWSRFRWFLTLALVVIPCTAAAAVQTQETQPAPAEKPEAAFETADTVLSQMSRLTGLPVKAPLKKQIVSREDVDRYLRDNLNAEYTPEEIHSQEAALKAFGVVGADFDLEKFLISFYTEQAAGFYDPRHKTMFMANWVEPDAQRMVLSHELTHALQDQSFNLWQFMQATRDDDDASSAREALVEGYATLAMMQVMLGSIPIEKLPSLDASMEAMVNQQMAEYPVFTKAPYFLRFQALFPYAQGMHFVRQGLVLGGWKRLNQCFTEPPVSTKQIFQPDFYFKPPADPPPGTESAARPLILPPPPALAHAPALKPVQGNVMGELGYDALLGQLLTPEEADKVTPSWVADRYLVYEGPTPGQFTLIARTRWSTAEAASAFCVDYRTILEKRWPEDAAAAHPQEGREEQDAKTATAPEVLFHTSGARQAWLLREGDECRWAEGVPEAQAHALGKWLRELP